MDKLDIVIPQGDTFSVAFPVTVDGVPIDDSWTAKAQVRTSPTASTVLHEWSVANSNITVDDGYIYLTVLPATSTAWKWVSGAYDLKITKAGNTYTALEGRIKINQAVTK